MARFTIDSTDGYSATELAILNADFEHRLSALYPDNQPDDISDLWQGSLADHVAEQVLAEFDALYCEHTS